MHSAKTNIAECLQKTLGEKAGLPNA